MRALRMTMTIAEELLAMGVAARDVVHMALGITGTYCRRRVHIDISSTLITISQDRGSEREPLTLVRTITLKYVNYQTIQALQNLALVIRDHHLPLAEAERRTEELLTNRREHSRWTVCLAGGGVSMGVVILFNGSILMSGLAFVMGFVATATMRILDKWGLATFYLQIITALLITLAAGAAQWLNGWLGWQVDTTMLVISGIVLLVAGLMIVGAFQDAIDEYYVTANARLLRVTMATMGIVVGVMTGLYIIQRFGISFPTTPDRLGAFFRNSDCRLCWRVGMVGVKYANWVTRSCHRQRRRSNSSRIDGGTRVPTMALSFSGHYRCWHRTAGAGLVALQRIDGCDRESANRP